MMDLVLPGRYSEACDYEAQSALRALLESDSIQVTSDDDMLDRIAAEIECNQEALARVAKIIDDLRNGTNQDDGTEAADQTQGKGKSYG